MRSIIFQWGFISVAHLRILELGFHRGSSVQICCFKPGMLQIWSVHLPDRMLQLDTDTTLNQAALIKFCSIHYFCYYDIRIGISISYQSIAGIVAHDKYYISHCPEFDNSPLTIRRWMYLHLSYRHVGEIVFMCTLSRRHFSISSRL